MAGVNALWQIDPWFYRTVSKPSFYG